MRIFFLAALLCALPLAVAAEKWTPEDVLALENARPLKLSRDGKLAVWVQSAMDKEKGNAVSHLHLRHLDEGYTVQLTRGKDSYTSPAFSPDGTRIASLTARQPEGGAGGDGEESQTQVWLIDLRGGEPYKLTDFKQGVKDVQWLDNESLLVTATEDPTLYAQEVKERKDTSNVVEDEENAAPVRLYRFRIESKKAERLTTNRDRITKTWLSDDGRWAVTVHERSLAWEYNQAVRPVTFLHDLRNGAQKQLFAGGKLLPQQVSFAPDASGFYFSAPFTTHPKYLFGATPMLYYYDIAADQTTQVNLEHGRGLGADFDATPDGLLALLAQGVRYTPARYVKTGNSWRRQNIEGEHAGHIFAIEVSRDGRRVAYDHSTASKVAQWYGARLDGTTLSEPAPITKLNSHLDNKTMARVETIRWPGARDEEVEGLLYYPHGYQEGKKYPLVLAIHGGPNGTDFDSFADSFIYPYNLIAQRGAFILAPNYHGSGNYGAAWAESISGGNYNELEWLDCERGVDFVIGRGLADPKQLGVMGWSNGSIITIEITTRTQRYKAASAGAGDVNWTSDWGNCQFGHAFDDYYIGATPLDDLDLYIKKSALFRLDQVTTPTIIFFGTIDRQVPTEQGWQHFRALQHLGKTDVRFILFPGEGHVPRKYVHQRKKLLEDLAWLDKYLFETGATGNASLRPASPLAAAVKLAEAGRVPETVERGAIAVGRFEVTRAQFAAFREGYHYAEGASNYPASGVSFEDAKAYCEWLSRETGQRYRLGTEKELGGMLKASAKENTLDAWAGYSVNPDDAAALAELVKRLPPDTLLKPVGSHPGEGEDPVFDLGGNVAEWVTGEDGAGKAMGGSADQPADPKTARRPALEYVGFRVVRELKQD